MEQIKIIWGHEAARKTIGGRLYNQLAGDDRECILLDGVVVKQLFEIMGIEARDSIEPKLIYRIGYDDAAAW